MGMLEGFVFAPVSITGATAYAQAQFANTVNGGFKNVGFRVSVATQNMVAKIQGSMDGTNWEDITARKLDNTAQAGVDVTVAAAANTYLFVVEAMGTLAMLPYYRVMVKNAAAGVVGVATVSGFMK